MACGKLEGADPPTLAKRMQEFANERVRSDAPEAGRTDGISAELQTKLQKLTRCENKFVWQVFVCVILPL